MSAGKGDSPRNCFSREYRQNFDAIFKKSRVEGRGTRASKELKKRSETLNTVRTVSPHPFHPLHPCESHP
jgi:hypothetical protein